MGEAAKNGLEVLAEIFIKSRWLQIMLFAAFIVPVLVWCWVGFVWPINDTQYTSTNLVDIPKTTQQLQIEYPRYLRYDGSPVELRITRRITDTLGTLHQPLTITLGLPPGIVLLSKKEDDSAFVEARVVFSPTIAQMQIAHLYLLNGRIGTGPNEWSSLLSWKTPQTVSVMAGYGPWIQKEFQIEVEKPGWRPIFRNFVNAVNTQSPLLFCTPSLLALFGVLVVTWHAQRTKALNDFRQSLEKGNITQALNDFERLKQLPFSTYDSFIPTKLLIEIAQCRGDLSEVLNVCERLSPEWQAAARGAVLTGLKTLPNSQVKKSWEAALDKFAQEMGLGEWEKIQITLKETQLRGREDWRLRPQLTSSTPALLAQELGIKAEQFERDECFFNPFSSIHAEVEFYFLFSEDIGGFWEEHPLLNQVGAYMVPCICFGLPGSGKTALAHFLEFKKWDEGNTLALYEKGLFLPQLEHALAEAMLKFLCARPFVWWQAGSAGRQALVHFFCSTLGNVAVLAMVDETLQSVSRCEYQEMGAATEDQKFHWRREDEIALKAIQVPISEQTSVQQIENRVVLTDDVWLPLARLSMQVLGFQQVVVALDNEEPALAKAILPCMEQWSRYGLILKLFLPQSLFPELEPLLKVRYLELKWSAKLLERMADWRMQRASNESGRKFRDIFACDCQSMLSEIFSALETPGLLAALWQGLLQVHDPGAPTFTARELRQAWKGKK